jgi:hypothetical protein
MKHYVAICNIVEGDVSAEVIATDYEGMVREGEDLAALHPHIVVKLPMTRDGVKAIKHFTSKRGSRPIAPWCSARDRRCWQPKRVPATFRPSLAGWMM